MIEPIEPTMKTKQSFIVADIENRKDGSVLYIGTSYRWNNEIVHETHSCWSDWFPRILSLATREKRFRTIYAHNGGGWDWLSLLEFLLKDERYQFYKIEGQRVGSKIVVLRVHIERGESGRKDDKRTRFCLRFADSLPLLRSKLSDLSAKFLPADQRKLDLKNELPEQVFKSNRKLFFRYLQGDCNSLLRILEKTLKLFRTKVANIDSLGLTIGSTAMKIWRTGFLKTPISIPENSDVKAFLRQGYRGGRVEVFEYGQFNNVNVYDINSLYPTAMLTADLPVSNVGDWTGIFRWKLPGIYQVQFRQHNKSIPPVLMVNGSGEYDGVGTFYIPELALLREMDSSCTLKLIKGYCFHQIGNPFSDYVTTLYKLRLSDPDGPVSLLCKYLLNSLYGKLAQRGEREQYLIFSDLKDVAEAIMSGRKLTELNLPLGVWSECKNSDVGFEHVGIAGTITSQARVLLYRGLMETGLDNLIYCDTDSVHTKGTVQHVGKQLGEFKLEFSGSGVYAGRKLYALRSTSGQEKVRAKGVSVGGRNGCSLDYNSMCRIVQGEKIKCRFFQPTTANETLKGKKSCLFRERKRTLRMVRK